MPVIYTVLLEYAAVSVESCTIAKGSQAFRGTQAAQGFGLIVGQIQRMQIK